MNLSRSSLRGSRTTRLVSALIGLLMLLAAALWDELSPVLLGRSAPDPGCPVAAAWERSQSDLIVECEGVVTRMLPDDREGSRHQRFIVELADGHTLLISHNIDLAPRIDDLRRGSQVRFRGEFEHNERGGVVHWTHHDPQGRRPGGWIEHTGRRYE